MFATNVTGKTYITYTAGLGTVDLESASLGEPRMYGYRFGS